MEKILGTGSIEGLEIEHVKRDDEYILAVEHFHSYHEIYYLLSGQRTFFIQNKAFKVSQGELVIIPSGQIHKIGPNVNSAHERILLRIDTKLLEDMHYFLREDDLLYYFAQNGGVIKLLPEKLGKIEEIMHRMIFEPAQNDYLYVANIKSLLSLLLIYILRNNNSQKMETSQDFKPPKLQKVQEIAEYISSNFGEDISLEDISGKFYISRYHLCRIFKEITGFTVLEYIHSNRIVHAQRLLKRTSFTVTKIAQEVGYNSITQFDKKFREISGMTPLEYRIS